MTLDFGVSVPPVETLSSQNLDSSDTSGEFKDNEKMVVISLIIWVITDYLFVKLSFSRLGVPV